MCAFRARQCEGENEPDFVCEGQQCHCCEMKPFSTDFEHQAFQTFQQFAIIIIAVPHIGFCIFTIKYTFFDIYPLPKPEHSILEFEPEKQPSFYLRSFPITANVSVLSVSSFDSRMMIGSVLVNIKV